MSDTKIFVDGLMSATLRDGVVRLEFGEFEADEEAAGDENAPPKMFPQDPRRHAVARLSPHPAHDAGGQ